MSFVAPEWFFLVPVLAVAGWRWRWLRFHEPLRLLGLLLLVLALTQPQIRLESDGLDLWVLADRSDSNAGPMTAQAREIEAILERSRGREDRLRFVDFAGEAVLREQGDPIFEGRTFQTRTGMAIQFALGQREPGRAARLLVLSDGFATEPLGPAVEQLLRSAVPMDYRLTVEPTETDWRVSRISAPPRVLGGESFMVEFEVSGSGEGMVPWEIRRNGAVAQRGEVPIRAGLGRVQLMDRVAEGGAVRYEARVHPAEDAHPENNVAAAWVEVAGGPKVLLLSNYPDDPMARVLRAQGLTVELVTEFGTLSAGSTAGARAVVISNVPAFRIPPGFLNGLEFFVRDQGGGLLMAGGENSFGSGGYFSSSIDPLLPVSMELKADQRKGLASVVITLDRSGSMSASVGNGLKKMDLADTGAARAVELLGGSDTVAIHAVDTRAHEIVPLTVVGPNRAGIIDQAMRIESTGGGIVVPAALEAAWDVLSQSNAGTRHVILFADANDASQAPANYRELAADMRAQNITISVIGMGADTDRSAGILKDVAELGGGRLFYAADPNDLPQVFAQEMVSVARAMFIREPVGTQARAGWAEVADRAPAWPGEVDGYNLSYLRPDASVGLASTDEYAAPLIASWQRGTGRVAAVTFPLGGDFSERVRAWPGYGDFVQTLTRWLLGDETPPGLAVQTALEGERMTLDLFYDSSWGDRLVAQPPTVMLAEMEPGRSAVDRRSLVWEKIEPGHFRAGADLIPGRMIRGAIRVGTNAVPFGPLTVAGSAEWAYDRDRLAELRDLSVRSGGVERLNLAEIWKAPRPIAWRGLREWLLWTFGAVFIADAILTRLGISLLRRRARS